MNNTIKVTAFFFYLICALSLIGCRKGSILPTIEAFQPGNYYYDLESDGKIYPKYLKLSISAPDKNKKEIHFEEYLSFLISKISDSTNSTRTMPYLHLSSLHSVYNAGVYHNYPRPNLLFDLSDSKFLAIPAYDYNIDTFTSKRYQGAAGSSINKITHRNYPITSNGKTYMTYRMQLGDLALSNKIEPTLHFLYVDKYVGLIRYEIRDRSTDTLVYQYTLNAAER